MYKNSSFNDFNKQISSFNNFNKQINSIISINKLIHLLKIVIHINL